MAVAYAAELAALADVLPFPGLSVRPTLELAVHVREPAWVPAAVEGKPLRVAVCEYAASRQTWSVREKDAIVEP